MSEKKRCLSSKSFQLTYPRKNICTKLTCFFLDDLFHHNNFIFGCLNHEIEEGKLYGALILCLCSFKESLDSNSNMCLALFSDICFMYRGVKLKQNYIAIIAIKQGPKTELMFCRAGNKYIPERKGSRPNFLLRRSDSPD